MKGIMDIPKDMKNMQGYVQSCIMNSNHVRTVTVPKAVTLEEPIRIELMFGGAVTANLLHIKAEAGSCGEIVLSLRPADSVSHNNRELIYVEAEPGASLRVIRLQRLGKTDTDVSMAEIKVSEDARVDYIDLAMGGRETFSGCHVLLRGKRSRSCVDCLYVGSGEMKQEFNYHMELQGAESEGEIMARGALAGKAEKLMKSTLDFVSGSAGAKGTERETVLALSDKTRNLSLPILLCGEEKVQGEHSTNTGRPDAGGLFYLMSRGLSEKRAKQLLIEASFAPVLDKLPDIKLKNDIAEYAGEVLGGE